MSCIQWSPLFDTGVAMIDAQHKGLVSIINECCRANASESGKNQVPAILNKLIQYAQKHFADEEKFMVSIDYPGLLGQQQEHAKLIEQVFELHECYEKGYLGVTSDLGEFLRSWLLDHVLSEDMKIRDYLQARKSA